MGYLTSEDVAAYQRDGSVIIKDVFSLGEVAAMISAVEKGDRVAETTRDRDDGGGRQDRIVAADGARSVLGCLSFRKLRITECIVADDECPSVSIGGVLRGRVE